MTQRTFCILCVALALNAGLLAPAHAQQAVSTYLGLPGASGGPTAGTGSAARLSSPTLMLPDGLNRMLLYDSNARTIYSVTLANNYGTLNSQPVASGVTVSGWAVESSGDILVADAGAHVVRRLTRTGGATIIAGVAGTAGAQDGPALSLGRLNQPSGVIALPNGDIWIADTGNHTIRLLSPAGDLSTVIGSPGAAGATDGTLWAAGVPGTATLTSPRHFLLNAAGDVLWVDANTRIRSVTANTTDTTTVFSGLNTSLLSLMGNNTLLYANSATHQVYRLPIGGAPTVIAGIPNAAGIDNGPTNTARLNSPAMVLPGPGGIYIVADTANGALRRVGSSLGAGPSFTVGLTNITVEVGNRVELRIAVAGTGTVLCNWRKGTAGVQFGTATNYLATSDALLSDTASYAVTIYDERGVAASPTVTVRVSADEALFNFTTIVDASRIPSALNSFVLDEPSGWIYFAEPQRHVVSRLNTNGLFESLAGFPGLTGVLDGQRTAARFNGPHSVALDTNGNVYVSDSGNHTIRKLTPAGQVTTFSGAMQAAGSTDGLPINSRYSGPGYLLKDPTGFLVVLDGPGSFPFLAISGPFTKIRGLDSSGNSATRYTVGNASFVPYLLRDVRNYVDHLLRGVVFDSTLAIRFFAVEAGSPYTSPNTQPRFYQQGNVNPLAGAAAFGNRDGTGANALFSSNPNCVLHDPFTGPDSFLVLDTGNHALRRLRSTNVVVTLAGGSQGYRDGLTPLFDSPSWGQLDAAGNLWVLDGGGRRLRKGVRTPRLQIVTAPVALDVTQGQTATFFVAASGSGALTYQWRKDGLDILGATAPIYNIPGATVGDVGNYSVVVANQFTILETTAVPLRILTPPTITLQPQPLTLTELLPGLYGFASFSVQASGSAPLSYQWAKDGVDIPGATQAQYAIVVPTYADQGDYTVTVRNPVGMAVSQPVLLNLLSAPRITQQPTSQSVQINDPVTFTVGVAGSVPLAYQWQLNGTDLAGATNRSLTLPAVGTNQAGSYSLRVSNSRGVTNSAPAVLTVDTNGIPVITTQPQPQSLTAPQGGSVLLSVGVTGEQPFSYQWRKNGTNLTGENLDFLLLNNTTTNTSGIYSVLITNARGAITSAPAVLTFIHVLPPVITAAPQSLTVLVGSNATFSVAASGTPPFSYQWVRGGVALTNNDTPTLTITNATLVDAGSYFVQVFNPAGVAASASATLTVQAPPAFLSQPQSLTVVRGATTNFQVAVSGIPDPVVAWFKNGVRLTNSVGYTAVNTTNLLVLAAQAGQAGTYVAVATNVAGASTSAPVTLTVLLPPVFTRHPTNVTLTRTNYAAAMPVTLNVAATGAAPLLYQWRFNGGDLPGETNAALVLTNVTRLENGVYQAVVANVAGSVASSNALVRVRVAQRVERPTMLPGQPFTLRFTDDNGEQPSPADLAKLEVQAATTLLGANTVWVTLTNGFTVVNGALQFADPASTNLLRRYYRVIEK